jgi:TolA-binding protein
VSASQDDWDREERDALAGLDEALAVVRQRHRHDPPVDQLRAAREGVLPPDAQAAADAHLRDSPWSRTLLEGFDPDAAGLDPDAQARLLTRIQREAVRASADAHRARWRLPMWLGPALVAAAVAAWFILRPGVSPVPAPQAEATVAVAEPAPAPAAFRLPFEKPEVRLGPGALTWRGAAGDNTFLTDVRPALDAYRQGDYVTADTAFIALAARYPQSMDVAFYQGMTALLLNDPDRAFVSLAVVANSDDTTFRADAEWFMAIATQHAGRNDMARRLLAAQCRQSGAAGPNTNARACLAAEQLDAAFPAGK